MNGFTKGVIGAVAASLLAWGAHQMTGADYIDGLEAKGKTALADAGMDGISLNMQRDPLARVAILDGTDDPAQRKAIKAALAAKGITNVRWAGEGDADGNAGANGGASAETVANCQAELDAIKEGRTINFRSGSAYMGEDSLALIGELADKLSACEGTNVAVGGHTDATGSDEVNQTLSKARADAVAAALAEKGVDASRVTATGYGSSQPKVPGDGANAENRRIEFTLSSSSDSGADAASSQGEE